ncbi:hypothetical protein AQUCO_12300010v1 [Aquilegia coerulea]|uniref:Uncharacterized protein n=1 Tax=Aquilegia coerulea TaxID=218851 RepID=A0A2G5C1Q0_AQUCA|nr:hypothetical protein AQUCO_12300010v1 [Aquilegia coerulea]
MQKSEQLKCYLCCCKEIFDLFQIFHNILTNKNEYRFLLKPLVISRFTSVDVVQTFEKSLEDKFHEDPHVNVRVLGSLRPCGGGKLPQVLADLVVRIL